MVGSDRVIVQAKGRLQILLYMHLQLTFSFTAILLYSWSFMVYSLYTDSGHFLTKNIWFFCPRLQTS